MATVAELVRLIRSDVVRALRDDDAVARTQKLRDIAEEAYEIAYGDYGSDTAWVPTGQVSFAGSMTNAWLHTQPDGTPEQVERVATVIATAANNSAFLDAQPDGVDVEWRTMRDDRVRTLHRPLDGQIQPAGQPFMVGGFPLSYPGQPVGPPEVWINCRCRLLTGGLMSTTATAEPDSLVAVSDTPWSQFSASDYSIEQWRRACLLRMPGGDPESKSTYKLPVREPGGALNRNGVHAAAAALGGARGGVDAPPEAKDKARRKLRGLYRQIGDEIPESLAADGEPADNEPAADDELVAVNTHDAPGWITNPRDTQRLRDYWAHGEGAAKIGWGTPGDFNRCRAQLGKYVHNPAWLAGTCANLHYVALGFWPGGETGYRNRRGSIEEENPVPDDPTTLAVYDAFQTAVTAAIETDNGLPPVEWFQNPNLTAATPATVDGDRYFSHLAAWGTCHVGIEGSCTTAPRSAANYAYFRTGSVNTTGGPVAVGHITLDTGHAEKHLGPNDTIRHYDDTGTVVADVAAGEDEFGIWVAGALRPGVTDEQRRALQAGALSGDWRRIAGNLELVAALVVNVPGFPIPRPELAASGEVELSLVAAAIVTVDPNVAQADAIATIVVDKMTAAAKRRQRAYRLNEEIRRRRIAAVHRATAVGSD